MKYLYSIAISLLLPFLPAPSAEAEPSISGTSSAASHGQTMIVSGADFGTKVPAAPLLWDNGEGKSLNLPQAVLDQGGWAEAWPGPSHHVRGNWELQYRLSGFRGVAAPHSRSSTFLTGGHWNDNTDQGRNVAVTADAGTPKNTWYASWYVRLDPLWPRQDGGQCTLVPNYKDYVFQPGGASYTGNRIPGDPGENAFNYDACTSCITSRSEQITPGFQQLCGGITPCSQEYCRNDPNRRWLEPSPSEVFGWKRNEVVIQRTPGMIKRTHYNGDSRTDAFDVSCPGGAVLEEWTIRSFTVGGFMKNSDSPGSPPYDYPNWSAIRDISDSWHSWQQRGSADEYFVTFNGSSLSDSDPDPWIGLKPDIVRIGGVDFDSSNEGAPGSLAQGQWAYGDFDGLGFPTVYVRLPAAYAERNPGNNGSCFLVLTARSGEANGRTHPDAFRYFDDMYIDTTFSRVVLANSASIGQATIVEPQIPSAWSSNSITVEVNLGALPPSGTAYVFVFDAENSHNITGFPVAIGSGGTTPSAPSNLTADAQ